MRYYVEYDSEIDRFLVWDLREEYVIRFCKTQEEAQNRANELNGKI